MNRIPTPYETVVLRALAADRRPSRAADVSARVPRLDRRRTDDAYRTWQALRRLTVAGLAEELSPAVYRLTAEGQEWLDAHPLSAYLTTRK